MYKKMCQTLWPDRSRWCLWGMIFLGVTLLLRVIGMVVVPLIPEEAYYWMYAHHPQLGYYDHPPMVAWVIRAGVMVFGDTEFGVRIVGHLLMGGTSVALFVFGRMWFGWRVGLISAILLHVLPVYFGIGFIATMDSALLFFWMLTLIGVSVALKNKSTWGWYLAGLATGLAFLSKYTAIFLPASIFIAVVGRSDWRMHLRTMHPYFGLVLAVVVASPVIVWNAQHDWVSFRFQFIERYAENTYNFKSMMVFGVMQVALLTPVFLAACFLMLRQIFRQRDRVMHAGYWLAISFFLPATMVVLYKSLKSQIHINWMAPIYLSMLPMLVRIGLAQLRLERHRGDPKPWMPGIVQTVGVCLVINASMLVYLIGFQPTLRWWSAFGPWDEIAEVVEEYEDKLEDESGREPLIVADGKYRLASVLAFYRTKHKSHTRDAKEAILFTTSQWILRGKGLSYPYWIKREDWIGRDMIYISNDETFFEQIQPWCERAERIIDARLEIDGQYNLVICHSLLDEPRD